jgi:hypothetical protein
MTQRLHQSIANLECVAHVAVEFYWVSKSAPSRGTTLWLAVIREIDRLTGLYPRGRP